MRKWWLLLGAVACEVTATLSLKAALTQPIFYIVVAIGYTTAFTLLAQVFRAGMSLGVAYGIWCALGVALTAALASLVFGEQLSYGAVIGIGLAIIGVLLVEIGSHRAGASSIPSHETAQS